MNSNRINFLGRAVAVAVAATVTVCGPATRAQLNIPSDGSDGALNLTSGTNVIDLSQAVNGGWSNNNSAHAGNGIYDSNNWAVVFKYSSVYIASNVFVKFLNHPTHAPVVWLVSGDVTINGDLSLDGQTAGYNAPQLAEPGPGGYRGGTGNFSPGVADGPGFGPGGGQIRQIYYSSQGAGGSFGTLAGNGSETYGNPSLLPLIGGSGGAGYSSDTRGGGGGGGAILIASAGTLSISGSVHAQGGSNAGGAGGGSGGGIRLIANTLAGTGLVQCLGGGGNAGGLGRIRIERVNNVNTIQVTPDPSIVPLLAGDTPLIWLPTNGPTATIVSVSSVAAPADPRASFGTYGPDVILPNSTNATVIVQTVNAETASQVLVRVSPRANGYYSETAATLIQTNSLNPLVLTWSATVPVKSGFASLIARVIRP
jgi:hypothetical protein